MKTSLLGLLGLGTAALVASLATAAVEPGAPTNQAKVDPQADKLLKEMSDYLARQKTFSVDTHYSTEVVQKDGKKARVAGESEVSVRRPNELTSEQEGPNGVTFYYDGKTVTLASDDDGPYAQTAAPKTIDATLDFARDKLGLDAPAADLIYSDPYKVLMADVVSGQYLGTESVDDATCHHLAFRNRDVDWQIWVKDGDQPLPCKFSITTLDVKSKPQFTTQFDDWNFKPSFDADTFQFEPEPGAKRVEFRGMSTMRNQGGNQ